MVNNNDNSSMKRWPDGAIVYHIYPRSFQDSNDDGVGDLLGIVERLDYIRDLGANAIWLSPFYPSPMADFGYDVADYCDVDPIFGTLDDFKTLLAATHERGMKLVVDLVPNHTSDEHAWFKESRTSRDNEYVDWYVWRDPHPDSSAERPLPPNNWRDALTGGSAWEWVPEREQFYLHSFDVKQPDLNWANHKVRAAIKDAMRFWLGLGVDGFRVDAVYWMAKEPLLSDDDINPDYVDGEDLKYNALMHNNSRGWPVVFAYLAEMAEVLKEDAYKDSLRFMVTEAYPDRHNPIAAYMNFYVGMDPEVAAPFNFEGLSLPWEAAPWRRFLKSFHHALSHFDAACVASYAFGNHDQPRIMSRLGEAAARSAAVMLLTLPGMVFIYYGDEIGMSNVDIAPEFVQDPAAKGDPKRGIGRDPERTPMQWSGEKNAGFSSSQKTWLPIAPDYEERNVEIESRDPDSFLSLYRALGRLRGSSEAMRYGEMMVLDTDHEHVLAFGRRKEGEAYLTLVNFSAEVANVTLPKGLAKLLLSSQPETKLGDPLNGKVELLPHEAAVFSLQ